MTENTHAPLRIGVLGAARITRTALLGPASRVPGVEVVAVAARDPQRARAFAARHRIPRVIAGYRALLDDPDVDAVYLPLPATLHAPWTIAAVEAGKHVLVEKPFTGNATTAQSVAEIAARAPTVVMEAYHSHYHPFLERAKEVLTSGEVGEIRSARAMFGVPIPPGRDIRWNFQLGGGGLLDVGYYPVRMLRDLFETDPRVVDARAHARDGIDRLFAARLDFAGTPATVVSSIWSRHLGSSLEVVGTVGRVRLSSPYQPHRGGRMTVSGRGGIRTEHADRVSTYDAQLGAFRDATAGGAVPTDAKAAVRQLRTIDDLYVAAGLTPRP